MSFIDYVSDAADALIGNVLPIYQAQVSSKERVEIARAQAGATVATEASRARIYVAMAATGVAAVALILLLKRR